MRMPDEAYGHIDNSQEFVNAFAMSSIYQGLLEYRANDYNDFALVPMLAEKWSVSADGKTVTLNLRKGVKWHNLPPVNGREFTSADVAWNAQYYVKSSGFRFLWSSVTGVETPDPYTAVIHLQNASASFVAGLAHRNNQMYPRELFEADGSFKRRAVGTGPFMLKEFVPSEKIITVRNPAYWEVSEADGAQLPYMDGVEHYAQIDQVARLAGVRTGQYDQMTSGGANTADEVKDLPGLGVRLITGFAPFTRDVVLSFGLPKWNDKRVRQAVSFALDRDRWIKTIYGGEGYLQGWVPIPGLGWTADQIKARVRYDPARAKQLLAEAGVPNLPVKLTGLRSSNSGLTSEGAELIAGDLRAAGFVPELDLFPDTTSLRNSRILPGTFEAMLYVQASFGADPTDYLSALVSSAPNTTNYGHIHDPELDKMIDEQDRLSDGAARKAVLDRIQEYLADQMWMVPLAQPKVFKPLGARVKGPAPIHASQKAVHIERTWLAS